MNSPPPDLHQRAKRAFLLAIERPPDERAALLDALCGDDGELRLEVGSLLANHHHESLLAAGSGEGGPLSTAAAGLPELPRVGRYTLVRLLGEGGMGVVYIALDELLDRQVAIKLLRSRGGGPSATIRMLREAQALARLSHPNVVTIHDVGETDGQIYIAMEFVTGVTLRTWLKVQPRGQAEVLAVFFQVGVGLAAAHAVGLVHRDIKPDNIMISADGRARVMDFGLARTSHEADARPLDPDVNILAADVTVRGSLIGTPAYMAPEQLLGKAADPRSDIYGFCVALYEALYGEHPFPDGPLDPMEAVLPRMVLPAASAQHVPKWLRLVVLRGLAFEAEARWPSLDALLAALARDPIAARRRRIRLSALALVVATLAAAAALGVVRLQRGWARDRAEHLAGERLAALDEAAARATAEGRPEQAEAMFQAFVADPEHRGTSVLARAWLRRGDQQRSADAGPAALDAYARAYVEARQPAAVVASLQAMAAVFRDEWEGPSLLQVVAALRARGVDDRDVARLAAFADLRMRDLPGAAAELARVDASGAALLSTLAAARPTALESADLVDLGVGHVPRYLAAARTGRRVNFLDAELREVGCWEGEGEHLQLVPGTSWVVARRGASERIVDVLAPDDAPLWRGSAEVGMFRVRAVDLDGDGARELLFGREATLRGFRVLTGLGSGEPRERPAHFETDQIGSDIDAIVAEDLDGDGRAEIVVSAGAWRAYDVRVFRVDDAGRLELAARRRLGRVGALAVVRRGEERRILALKDDRYPSPRVFPEAPHTGPTPGVYLLDWTGDELAIDGMVALPRRDGLARFHSVGTLHAGDFDGDGVDEAAALLRGDQGDELGIVRQHQGGGLELLLVGDLAPHRTLQFDADPADELLVTSSDRNSLWILGTGDRPLPSHPAAPHDRRRPPAALVDPVLALRWTRADELAAIGLPASAAASLQDAANLTADPAARRDLLDRAAALHVAAGDDAVALAVDRELTGAAALARDVGALLRLGRYDEAHARAGHLIAATDVDPETRAEAIAVRARLDPLLGATTSIRFDAPLDPSWQIERPAALRRDASARALALTTVSDGYPTARMPLDWHGGPLHLDIEFTLDRIEFSSCLGIEVRDDTGVAWGGGGICGVGGAGQVTLSLKCQTSVQSLVHELPALPPRARVRLRLTWFDATFECSLDTPAGTLRRVVPTRPLTPSAGPSWLVLGGAVQSDERSHLASGALHNLREIRGARLAQAWAQTPRAGPPHRSSRSDRPRPSRPRETSAWTTAGALCGRRWRTTT
ncbi:MAG: protein kinase [Nannocystaceae bacterium]